MKWSFWHTAGIILLASLTFLNGFLLTPRSAVWAWIVLNLILMALLLVIGQGATGFWKGALINEDYKVSLSRFQMACWTVIVLSTFLTAVFTNFKSCPGDPLAIKVPDGLWILMGISTTSLVASSLILSTKRAKGLISKNAQMKDATMKEMFQVDEVSHAERLDLSKIQMFYFTVVTLIAYAVAVIRLFSDPPHCVASLPAVSDTMAALLGISHAGYLTSKAVPRAVPGKNGQ